MAFFFLWGGGGGNCRGFSIEKKSRDFIVGKSVDIEGRRFVFAGGFVGLYG